MLLQLLRRNGLDANLRGVGKERDGLSAGAQTVPRRRTKVRAHLRGLTLLLELLELLRCDEADWFVAGDQLGASGHGGQDDVPAQTADAAQTGGGGGEHRFETLPAQLKLVLHVSLSALELH